MLWQKKWGILIKRESESLDFTGLEIPRDFGGEFVTFDEIETFLAVSEYSNIAHSADKL